MSRSSTLRPYAVALRAMLVATLALGLVYPLLITGVAAVAMPDRAAGSLVTAGAADEPARTVGSSLIGQSFTDPDGVALPGYLQSRPSAAGEGYDGGASSGSNLGPENTDLVAAVEQRRTEVAQREGVDVADVPADAVTASASGLDPHISPAYALLQVPRIARERGLPESEVESLMRSSIAGRDLGFLGEERVNVLAVNIALDELSVG
ncbi:potassium-transporting ATPase subunit KdpC [Serinibacter arcticus]|uniref:Potassium-transporting ATPase KdpC subunit n=1 Tax=Serinibacter arcticus TaxID=1655435 RepID=A0A4Z1E6J0_9MICO|nr:potassium-transporting ATPase subunit KdpC [Serinibacter arcticus]TGO05297.1 Potassium-transporting ATPase C chain [Serinibacter arcticus]